jgi:hypothetical protein
MGSTQNVFIDLPVRQHVSLEVEPGDWAELDPWWSAYTQNWPIARSPTKARTLDTTGLADCWEDLDPWWQTYTDSSPLARSAASTRTLVTEQLTDSWNELDPWWEIYTETGHETAVEIAGLLDRSNEEWRRSEAPFDTDPLASALTRDRGPLLPNNEEGWSDWLARLLRPSAALITELFDVEVNEPPDAVVREDQLSKEEDGFRRPDVLILYPDRGISIEVKLDDPHYGKTAETAGLIERDYPDQEWTHALLLPERNIDRLRSNVEPPVRSPPEEGLQIEWEAPGPVSVLYWRDVTAAIRTLLRRAEAVDDQWAANAYLFCAAAEQQLINFQPQPMIDRIAESADVIETIQPIGLAGALEEQLTYLSAMQNP